MYTKSDGTWLRRAALLGEEIMVGLDLAAYACIEEIGPGQMVEYAIPSGWLNYPAAVSSGMTEKSTSPARARNKMGDLWARHGLFPQNVVLCGPCLLPMDGGPGYPGGVRVGQRGIALSGRPSKHDVLIAAAMHCGGHDKLRATFGRVERVNGWYAGNKMAGSVLYPVIILNSAEPAGVRILVSKITGVQSVEVPWDVGGFDWVTWVQQDAGDTRGPEWLGLAAISA